MFTELILYESISSKLLRNSEAFVPELLENLRNSLAGVK